MSRHRLGTGIALMLAGAVLAAETPERPRGGRAGGGFAAAGGEAGRGAGRGPGGGAGGEVRERVRTFLEELREARRAHFEAQMEENQAFREAVRATEPDQAIVQIITHVRGQYHENVKFMAGQLAKIEAFFNGLIANAPTDEAKQRLTSHLQEVREHFATREQTVAARYEKLMAALEALKARTDLTWEEIAAAFRANRPPRRGHGDGAGDGAGGGAPRRRGGEAGMGEAPAAGADGAAPGPRGKHGGRPGRGPRDGEDDTFAGELLF